MEIFNDLAPINDHFCISLDYTNSYATAFNTTDHYTNQLQLRTFIKFLFHLLTFKIALANNALSAPWPIFDPSYRPETREQSLNNNNNNNRRKLGGEHTISSLACIPTKTPCNAHNIKCIMLLPPTNATIQTPFRSQA